MNWLDEMAVFEREMLTAAKIFLKNPKLRKADIHEWAYGPVTPLKGEIAVKLDLLGCHICIPAHTDKRQAA